MELGIHFRNNDLAAAIHDLPEHLTTQYGETHDWSALLPAQLRVYLGDEFCVHRLPRPHELEQLVHSATQQQLPVTFLTPPLSNSGLEKCTPLFDCLQHTIPQTEVVVNDWGVLLFFQKKYPSFQLSVGRLLNKGFKDPRRLDAPKASQLSTETAELFNSSTFDAPGFQQTLHDLRIRRVERDVLPYENLDFEKLSGLSTSIYFPYGYVTTGRVCWIASFRESERKRFAISDKCQRHCNRMSLRLKLKHDQIPMQLYQGGNTVFYRYPSSTRTKLISMATQHSIRLVYQGFAIPGPDAQQVQTDGE